MQFRWATIFVNADGRLRNGWWVAAYLAILFALVALGIVIADRHGREVGIFEQAGIILVATAVVQLLRRRSLSEVWGNLGLGWLRQCGVGCSLGFLLMALPTLLLTLAGWVDWQMAPLDLRLLLPGIGMMAAVAFAEELLFRGLLFQRMIAGVGVWPAQLAIAGLFLLTHLNNPGMDGATRLWAGTNIFAASLLFGLAYLKTKSLALPFGLHFMANVTQGIIFGFGVSGTSQPSLFEPTMLAKQTWLTGGSFGLEASLPGTVMVVAMLLAMSRVGRIARDARLNEVSADPTEEPA